jgi:hypothetical protein
MRPEVLAVTPLQELTTDFLLLLGRSETRFFVRGPAQAVLPREGVFRTVAQLFGQRSAIGFAPRQGEQNGQTGEDEEASDEGHGERGGGCPGGVAFATGS